jgi:glycosyltransferase involved in cell wall biosynthesis
MRITLAFTIYNKEHWVESILNSWIENAANKENLEIIIVFDDLKDNSELIAKRTLDNLKIDYKFLYAQDKHEIFCNRLALEASTGDYVIFIQDDNWIYDKNWDLILLGTIKAYNNSEGVVSFLAGAEIIRYSYLIDFLIPYIKFIFKTLLFKNPSSNPFYPIFRFNRLESDRTQKKENFTIHNIKSLPIGIWEVNLGTRPFCISRDKIIKLEGLDKVFLPHTADDVDLSLKCIGSGYKNLYIPFNLKNISTIGDSILHGEKFDQFQKGYSICFKRHKSIIKKMSKCKINQSISLSLNGTNDSLNISKYE